MQFSYRPSGVCSRMIDVILEDGKVIDVKFTGGCSGNTQGVAALAKGQDARELIEKLKDIKCGMKSTSCPAELAKALKQALEA